MEGNQYVALVGAPLNAKRGLTTVMVSVQMAVRRTWTPISTTVQRAATFVHRDLTATRPARLGNAVSNVKLDSEIVTRSQLLAAKWT